MLCDSNGLRNPGVNWVSQIAYAQPFSAAPSLKTVTFQQVSGFGLDFIMKRPESHSPSSVTDLCKSPFVSILFMSGDYQFNAGDTVEQWRGEGTAIEIDLEELISVAPNYGLVGMLASKRATDELRKIEGILSQPLQPSTDMHRTAIEKHAKFIELVQQTRRELENGNVTREELEEAIIAFRFFPNRMERLQGGCDLLTWDRWEWKMQTDEKGYSSWDVRQLLPF